MMKTAKNITGGKKENTQLLHFTGTSLSADDKYLYLLSDRNGHPNVWIRELATGAERMLTDNERRYLKSYMYFDGDPAKGLGKASIYLEPAKKVVYFIQDNCICKVDFQGKITLLNQIPHMRMTAFTHVSRDGKRLCVPMTDHRAFNYSPEKDGGDIGRYIQKEQLTSYLYVYNTKRGSLLHKEAVQGSWITHAQFNPTAPHLILYNREWGSSASGFRQLWLFDQSCGAHRQLRREGVGRSAKDRISYSVWSRDGSCVLYHGIYENGAAFIGKIDAAGETCTEIILPDQHPALGYFALNQKKQIAYDQEQIRTAVPDWKNKKLQWVLRYHQGDIYPVYNHKGNRIYFSAEENGRVGVYEIPSLR